MTLETALIVGLSMALIWLAWEYVKVHRQLVRKQMAHDRTIKAVHERSLKILDTARESAAKILKEARIGAAASRAKLGEKMDAAMETVAQKEILDFKKALEVGTIEAQKSVGGKIAKRYDEIERELADYKKAQLQAVDDQVKQILQTVGQKVLGKMVNLTDHADLVVRALEEAKRNGIFN